MPNKPLVVTLPEPKEGMTIVLVNATSEVQHVTVTERIDTRHVTSPAEEN